MASSPSPPNPNAQAAAQQRAEVGAAGASSVMNNPNIINPYGSQSYSIAGWEEVPDARGPWFHCAQPLLSTPLPR